MTVNLTLQKGSMTTTVEIWNSNNGLVARHAIAVLWAELDPLQSWRQIEYKCNVDGVTLSSGVLHNMEEIKALHARYVSFYNNGGRVDHS